MAWWWGWSSILKVLKVTSLQCLDNISKNKLWLEFILVFIKIKTSTSWIINFWLKQTCPKYPKRKFVKLLQYIKKRYHNCFCVLLWCKTFRYFMGSQSCLLLSRFLYFSPKKIHIYIIFHQQCKTIHLEWITFIVIHTFSAIQFWAQQKYYFENIQFERSSAISRDIYTIWLSSAGNMFRNFL